MAEGRIERIVPTHLPVVVGMHIDPARRGIGAVCLYRLACAAVHIPDASDLALGDGDVSLPRRRAAAVNDERPFDEIVVHVS